MKHSSLLVCILYFRSGLTDSFSSVVYGLCSADFHRFRAHISVMVRNLVSTILVILIALYIFYLSLVYNRHRVYLKA